MHCTLRRSEILIDKRGQSLKRRETGLQSPI
jgi:hypothetical protein